MRKTANSIILAVFTATSVISPHAPKIIPEGTSLIAAAVVAATLSIPSKSMAAIMPVRIVQFAAVSMSRNCDAGVMDQLCSSVTSFLADESAKADAALKACKQNCRWKKSKDDLIDAARKKAKESCAKGEAPDINDVNKGLDGNAKAKLKSLYDNNSRMFDGTAKLEAVDFNAASSKNTTITGKTTSLSNGGKVTDLKSSEPDTPKLNSATEFSLSGKNLFGETTGSATTKKPTVLLASAASAKTSADNASASSAKSPANTAASAKTAVAAGSAAPSAEPEPTVDCKCYYNPEDWAGGWMSPSECEAMMAIKCCPEGQHKNAAGKCVERGGSWFQGSWFEGWKDNAKLFADWVTGQGDKERHYGPNDRLTLDMQNAKTVQLAREEYQGKEMVRYENGIDALFSSGFNPGQQQVGGYRLTLTPNPDGTVHFRIDNDLSLWSFFYHLPFMPLNIDEGLFRNIHQTIEWDEKIPKK
ncbi:MAG: hypothetical protein KKH85_05585 [Proteobacteria bacterium]|nr:hypothetical protein [Pseudomonadota bacterium]